MDSFSLSSIWNAPGSQPHSRTASAADDFKYPPQSFVLPSMVAGNAALRNAASAQSLGWNLSRVAAVDPLTRPTSSNIGGLVNALEEAEITHDEYWRRYRQQQSLRKEESDFMLLLLHRLDQLQAQVDLQSSSDGDIHVFQRKAAAENSALTSRLQLLEDRLRRSENLLALDPFVLVLIDGDHLLFDKELVLQGELGAEEAASKLNQRINRYVSDKLSHVPSNVRIVVKVFSDAQSLARIHSYAAPAQDTSRIGHFKTAFSRVNVNYDWVDVGKGYAQVKIQNYLMAHLQDPHCRHVLIGCSHGTGESQMLKPLLDANNDIYDLVTLISASDAKANMKNPRIRSTTLENYFHTQSMSMISAIGEQHRYPSPPVSRPNSEAPTSRTSSAAGMKENLGLASSQPVIKASQNPVPRSWTSTVKAPTPPVLKTGNTVATKGPAPEVEVLRNRNGQRIDPIVKHDKDEVERVKKMKLCNVHFLRDECPHGDDCSHVHRARPTASMLKYLALVARMAPCMNGSWCEDRKCIYGHMCQAPEGHWGDPCIFADQCRFPKELHRVDRTVVRTTKV